MRHIYPSVVQELKNIASDVNRTIILKSYRTIEYVCVTIITFGLIMLNISRSNRGKGGVNSDTTFGFVLISIALFADALIGNVQEKFFGSIIQQHQNQSFTQFFGTFLSGFVALLNGQLTCLPVIFYSPGMFFYIVIFCLFRVIGENFIMVMVNVWCADNCDNNLRAEGSNNNI